MKRRILLRGGPVALMAAAFVLGTGVGLPAIAEEKDPAQAKREARLADPDHGQMRRTTTSQRQTARLRQAAPKTGVSQSFAGVNKSTATMSPLASGRSRLATMALPLSTPDYFGIANWANSPLPTVVGAGAAATPAVVGGVITAIAVSTGGAGYTLPSVTITDTTGIGAVATATESGGVITGVKVLSGGSGYTAPTVTITGINANTGMSKFVDLLPGICGVSPWGASGRNGLGQCIPIAAKDTTTYPGSDYYQIGLKDYSKQMHSNLPATKLRGYTDLSVAGGGGNVNQYLGPLIVAKKGTPVRVKFTNQLGLGSAGDLFIPTDTTYMGAGMGPGGANYSQNRATLHLHGGNTPWISDGTPHQWTVPAGETSTPFLKGLSSQDVPGMPSGAGSMTFYWTNQQSERFMFYHDHAYGITRLNVYAGEAAGYLLLDPVQEDALAAATVPGTLGALVGGTSADPAHIVPLVIQDKTFVPDDGAAGGQLAATDPTWDLTKFGGKGSLWFPHVYMPNQNPFDLSGSNPFGRWDYGPWFWPPQNPNTFVPQGQPQPCQSAAYPGAYLTCPGTPNPSGTPEGFMDTMVVNGTAYPTLPVAPAPYRFQILSAGNDRALNLGLYYAADALGNVCNPNYVGLNNAGLTSVMPALSACTEIKMVPAVQHASALPATTLDKLLACAQPTATSGAMLAIADMTNYPTTGLPPGCWPSSWPTDGRDGGVPDPTTAGPPIIQIGTEGGLLPAPAAIPSTPMNYEYNRRSITVLNVWTHGLVLGPAERADAIVDFSKVPSGSVLILYNDGPAPVPAFDPRVDYYTGDADQTSSGGAPTTMPGFGPNTRTVMQIQVNGTATATFNYTTLATAMPALFASTQDKIIVPETAYPATNGGSVQDNYARIQDTSLAFFTGGAVGSLNLIRGGFYTSTPSVTIAAPPTGTQATAMATLATTGVGPVIPAAPNGGGFGYSAAPAVSFTGGGGTGAAATAVLATSGGVRSIAVGNGGSGYTAAPTVNIAPSPLGCVPVTNCATATATVRGNGQRNVTGITVTNPGLGYTTAPAVTFSGGGGSGATATAVLGFGVASFNVTAPGTGYSSAPTVTVATPPAANCNPATVCVRATASSTLPARPIGSLTLTAGGTGYVSAPNVSIFCPGAPPIACGSGGVAAAVAPAVALQPKAIQELFTLDYGRMNATLGVELPFTNFATQTTIPYGYTDPPTEIFGDGETQYWKITHNGVDTHWIHFHLFNVQVINRVGWDGAVKPPDANELSWKDTVRMNPLEDIIVALRPLKQILPWTLPISIRPLDVTEPVGSRLPNQFANVDPANQPATTVNDLTNFGWEYVWHCHILGHEENDMMRAMVLGVAPQPAGPVTMTKTGNGANTRIVVNWTAGATADRTGFTIQRATVTGGVTGPFATVPNGAVGPNVFTFTDNPPGGTYKYQVIANNVVGYTRQYAPPITGWPHPDYPALPTVSLASITR